MNVLEFITDALVGKKCDHEGEIYTIKKLTINRNEISITIENDDDLITIPMSMARIEAAVSNANE